MADKDHLLRVAKAARSAGEAAKVVHEEATAAGRAAHSAGRAVQALKATVDDHEGRIRALEGRQRQPAPAEQPAGQAPQLRTGGPPDLPDPVIYPVTGGLVIDRVQRDVVKIGQLPVRERSLDEAPQSGVQIPAASRSSFCWWLLLVAISGLVAVALVLAAGTVLSFRSGKESSRPAAAPAPVTPAPAGYDRFSRPVTQGQTWKNSDGSYTVTVPANRFGWTWVHVPAGRYTLRANGEYQWDPATPEPIVGPSGASWTPSGVSAPEEFPLPGAPIAGLLGKVGGFTTYLGEKGKIQTQDGKILLGLNERWLKSAYADNHGVITVVLIPIK